jgi:hypothetical protein
MGKIYGNGINQGDLADLLGRLKTNFNAILAKLDLDGGVTDTNYAALHAVTLTAGIQTTRAKGIRDQGVVLTFLSSLITKFNLVLTKLDADVAVNGTNYVSTTAMTNKVGTKHLKKGGMNQGSLVHQLDHVIAKINALNAKLDLDSGVSGTDYASLWNVTDNVVTAGTQA